MQARITHICLSCKRAGTHRVPARNRKYFVTTCPHCHQVHRLPVTVPPKHTPRYTSTHAANMILRMRRRIKELQSEPKPHDLQLIAALNSSISYLRRIYDPTSHKKGQPGRPKGPSTGLTRSAVELGQPPLSPVHEPSGRKTR